MQSAGGRTALENLFLLFELRTSLRRKNVTEGACIYTNAWALVTEIEKKLAKSEKKPRNQHRNGVFV